MQTAPRMLLDREEEFREAVKKSGGRVVVLVHPFYASADDTISGAEFLRLVQYQRVRSSLFKRSKIPVVIFEEKHRVPQTHANTMKIAPFFVETHPDDPTPVRSWNMVHEALRKAGVSSILIGGMHALSFDLRDIDYHSDARRAEAEHRKQPYNKTLSEGCAGRAYIEFILARHSKVRWLPNLAFPERPHDK